MHREADIARNDYSKRRIAAINEYNAKVKNGEIRKPNIIETSLKTAHGHEDNPSVQNTVKSNTINVRKKIGLTGLFFLHVFFHIIREIERSK